MQDVPKSVLLWKNKIARALAEAGQDSAAEHVGECAEHELLLCCEGCGHKRYVVYHCQSRICPICSWSISKDRAKYSEALLAQMQYPKFLTLTMPMWKGNPRDGIKYLREAFTKLRSRKLWKVVRGGCYQIELKWKNPGWHIHVHVLLDAPFLPKQHIFSAWREILKTPYASIDIRACRTKAQRRYVTKYVSKNEDFHGDEYLAVEWYLATKGSRLYGTFGTWYNAKMEELLNPEEFEVFKPACENCGSPNHMFFARDGPFIFKKEWESVKASFIGDWEIKRKIEAKPCPETFDFLDA